MQFFKCLMMTLIFLDFTGWLSPRLVPEVAPFSYAENSFSVSCLFIISAHVSDVCLRILFKCFVLNVVSFGLCAVFLPSLNYRIFKIDQL